MISFFKIKKVFVSVLALGFLTITLNAQEVDYTTLKAGDTLPNGLVTTGFYKRNESYLSVC